MQLTRVPQLVICVFVLGMFAGAPSPSRADDFKDNAIAKGLGKAVIYCVRPSNALQGPEYKPYIVDASTSVPKTGRFDITIEMGWYGLWTKSPYTSKFTIKTDVRGGFEILGIDYTDNCLVPAPDVRLLNGLIRELNKKFKEEADR